MIDPVLLICTLVLTSCSILTLSGSLGNISKLTTTGYCVQIGASIVGMIAMSVLALIDYEELANKFWPFFFGASIFLLVITLVFGVSEGTNKSYLRFGSIGIQPSEFVKASYILTFSKHLASVKNRINSPKSLLGLMLHAGSVIGLVLVSGDLGVALVYMGLTAVMLFCAGLSVWYFAAAGVAAVVAFPYLWPKLALYQQQRILVGFDPEKDPLGKGMQPLQSRQAIANGGVFGQGIFGGYYYKKLYASHTDFIYATFCEKFGFVGGTIVIAALVIMVIRILTIAARAETPCGRFICIGAAALIILQSLENLGMCMAFLPVIGITLPFMSYGGSSMLSMYLIIGLVQSVRAHKDKYFFEIGEE